MGNLNSSELNRLLGWLSRDYERAVSTLTTRQQECIVLLFIEEYTEKEIASELGISRSTVAGHKREALQKLRKCFIGTKQKAPHPIRRYIEGPGVEY